MHAVAGDELIVRGRSVGDVDREGIVIEVRGEGGAPPYLVRRKDGHESLFTPSSDTVIDHPPWRGVLGVERTSPAVPEV
jgi:hypothetical protein